MSKRRTFSTWLQSQAGRNDPVGDLARAAQEDATAPVWAYRPGRWRAAYRRMIAAVDEAFKDFANRQR